MKVVPDNRPDPEPRITPEVQRAAKRAFLDQAEQALWRLADTPRLDARVAVLIVKRAIRSEMLEREASA